MIRAALLVAVALVAVNAQTIPDCTTYCSLALAACQGANLLYPDTATCMAACAAFPNDGVTTVESAPATNSLACRQYHAGVAGGAGSGVADYHCPHASFHGGGVCGTLCQAYCNVYINTNGTCASLLPIYQLGQTECELSYCGNFAPSATPWTNFTIFPTTGNSRECRAYHAYAAQTSTDSTTALAHCNHATPLSVLGICTTDSTGDGPSDVYCENHINACGTWTTNPTLGQWADLATCKAVAPIFGRSTHQDAQAGDSIDCRNYHALVASSSPANAAIHCLHSGFDGKNYCSGTSETTGMDDCTSFCSNQMKVCTGTNQQYPDVNTCYLFCSTMNNTFDQPWLTSGNSLQCRFYHLEVAAGTTDTNLRAAHCYHSGPTGGNSAALCGTEAQGFCNLEMAACPVGTSNQQYASRAQCESLAATFPDDNSGTLAAPVTSGNSVQCRTYHAAVAMSSPPGSNIVHCPHTGLTGNGTCGNACQAFCSLVSTACSTAALMQYATTTECLAYCASFPSVGGATLMTTSGNSLECRLYHGSVAQAGDDSIKAIHCPHTGVVSASNTCGTACDAYCNTVMAACTGTNMQFTNWTDCEMACAGYSTAGAAGDTTGNTLQCRQYHAGVALTGDATAKSTHCPHAGSMPTAFCVAGAGSSTGMIGAATAIKASFALVGAAILAALAAKQL